MHFICIYILFCIWGHYWTKEAKGMAKGANTCRRFQFYSYLYFICISFQIFISFVFLFRFVFIFIFVFHLYLSSYLYLMAFGRCGKRRWHMQELDDHCIGGAFKGQWRHLSAQWESKAPISCKLSQEVSKYQAMGSRIWRVYSWKFMIAVLLIQASVERNSWL